jgi:hypothetical protein
VDVVGEGLHVGEFVVSVDDALRVAVALPGVVDVDVYVASVAHTGGDEEIGRGADVLICDLTGEEVPAVPAHGRSGGGDGFGLGERGEGQKEEGDGEGAEVEHGFLLAKRFEGCIERAFTASPIVGANGWFVKVSAGRRCGGLVRIE